MNLAESFSIRDLGVTIAKILNLQPGEGIEIARDKLDSNRVLVIRIPELTHAHLENHSSVARG